ncbi:MAG: translation initiation factor IF-2 [Clostridia bacterium]|nr:translation initiation factor IF-2 [Clostridia bacterium]
MPREKYRVHEVAKDFGINSKKILEILEGNSPEPRKHMTALEDAELDLIFDTITKENEVESFDEYFAAGERERAEKQAAAQNEAEEKTEAEDKKEEAAKEKAEEKAEAKPEPKKEKAPAAAKKEKKSEPAKEEKAPKKPESKKEEKPKTAAAPAAPSRKEEKAKEKANKPLQARTKGERKHVDTRSSNVDLEKYNERYEQIAPANKMRDMGSSKQKIKQKSQQYRKQGMRSSKRETEAERLKRIAAERAKKQLVIKVPDEITVGELASMLKMTASEVIKKLFSLGVMATVNEVIDFDTAEIVATELGAKVEKQVVVSIEDRIIDDSEDKEEDLVKRDPVVVVMGHVDHGKTSILDAIRNTAVTATEAGGITQHIGAYRVECSGQMITFLDTPGHAAFTSMRARGAMATDIAVLVVAADDGIMPQTIEAINHAKAANIQIIVAINKMDKEGANPERIKQQLTEYNLVPEEWGGDTICVPVSAKTQMGIDSLLESILLVAEMSELKANPNRAAKGVVIEARLDKGRGPVATLLVQNGTMRTGDILVAGTAVGRVRVMVNEKGRRLKEAGPSVPVEITGLAETPNAGDSFDAVSDEKLARELVEQRKQKEKEEQFKAYHKVTLDNLFSSLKEGEMKELDIVVKADVQGSVEAVKQNLEKLSNDEVRVRVIHGGVGAINDSDVMLANVSNAIIVGFNVRPDANAQASAERDGVEMRMYRVIYDCIEEVEAAMKGMLAPKFREVMLGKVEVRTVMNLSSAGKIAGSYVLEGKVTRNAQIRVVRDGIVIAEDEIASLRRFKDDVKEVASGFECGIGLAKFNDIKEGDIFEAFVMEEYRD